MHSLFAPDLLRYQLTGDSAVGTYFLSKFLLGTFPGYSLIDHSNEESVDFPLNLPVGDLSRFIRGGSEKAARNTV